ncbi:MAG: pyridoxal phosphate-dependent aminotransferase [Oscillospiraceae bacterium]|nr:pyridoxal phosphate-dependent aminotransferase [Oscillospiraceae bacterium]
MSEQLIFRDRRGTNAMKWNYLDRIGFKGENLLGMWVADMDFASPECVRRALREAADFGVFGYDAAPKEYHEAFIAWEKERHGLEIDREWIRFSPGVVTGFYWLVKMLTEPGDSVLIQTPVYYPFMSAIEDQGRKLVRSELVNTNGIYTVDYEDFERKITEEAVRVFILCSPHNPIGRIWTRAELAKMLEICRRHSVKVISDEIHHDFELGGHKHTPTLAVGDYGDMVAMLTAPSKTFNLAGLQNSFVILPDKDIRDRYDAALRDVHIMGGNSLGNVAAAAAYTGGADWLESVLRTVEDNDALFRARLAEGLPKAVISPLEGTYLLWVDLGAYVAAEDIKTVMEERCGLALDYGTQFGGNAPCHIRVNLATDGAVVEEAAARLIRNLS